MAAKKPFPVVRNFPLSEASPVTGSASRLVDVGRCLSQINRRLYRSGRLYRSKIDLQPNANQTLQVYALRNDWAVRNAFKLAYEAYRANNDEERALMSEKQVGRWEDFRITDALTIAHAPVGPVMYNSAMNPIQLVNVGEFPTSSVVDSAGTTRTFTWGSGGGTGTKYSVLYEYDRMGNAFQSPETLVTGGGAYGDLEADIQTDTMDDLQTQGRNPPYDATGVNHTSPWVRIATLDATNPNATKLSTGFFDAPCGLIVITGMGASNVQELYELTVQSGDYKGVHAPSMLE